MTTPLENWNDMSAVEKYTAVTDQGTEIEVVKFVDWLCQNIGPITPHNFQAEPVVKRWFQLFLDDKYRDGWIEAELQKDGG